MHILCLSLKIPTNPQIECTCVVDLLIFPNISLHAIHSYFGLWICGKLSSNIARLEIHFIDIEGDCP